MKPQHIERLKVLSQDPSANVMNNRYAQYLESMTGRHETVHDWLRYYLNYTADKMEPKRHSYLYPNRPPIPPEKRKYAGILPMISAVYYLMLKEEGAVPHINPNASRDEAFNAIRASLRTGLKGKNVFFLPGRAGYEAIFVKKFGAEPSLTTNERYIDRAREAIAAIRPRRISSGLLLNCNIDEVLTALVPHRADISQLLGVNVSLGNPVCAPDIAFSTNMFNTHRFNSPESMHHVNIAWQTLLHRILAVGTEKTRFYFTPAIDYDPAFNKKELLREVGSYADISFYDPCEGVGRTVVPSKGDFAFAIRLKRPVPRELLSPN